MTIGETRGASAPNHYSASKDPELAVLRRDFDASYAQWKAAAYRLRDLGDRNRALSRLEEIKAGFEAALSMVEGSGANREVVNLVKSSLLTGGPGGKLEDGDFANVVQFILKKDISKINILIGDDGFLGFGDGLDDDEWDVIQDGFFEDLAKFKSTFDLKPLTSGALLFNQFQAEAANATEERRRRMAEWMDQKA